MTKKTNRTTLPDRTKVYQGQIPDKVALIPDDSVHYLISFSYYNSSLCEIDFLEKNRPKECLHVLKRIAQSKPGRLREQNVDHIRIGNSGEYKKLYNQLPSADTELFEHKVQGTGRIFYFTTKNRFYVVAITNNHFETDKVRR